MQSSTSEDSKNYRQNEQPETYLLHKQVILNKKKLLFIYSLFFIRIIQNIATTLHFLGSYTSSLDSLLVRPLSCRKARSFYLLDRYNNSVPSAHKIQYPIATTLKGLMPVSLTHYLGICGQHCGFPTHYIYTLA